MRKFSSVPSKKNGWVPRYQGSDTHFSILQGLFPPGAPTWCELKLPLGETWPWRRPQSGRKVLLLGLWDTTGLLTSRISLLTVLKVTRSFKPKSPWLNTKTSLNYNCGIYNVSRGWHPCFHSGFEPNYRHISSPIIRSNRCKVKGRLFIKTASEAHGKLNIRDIHDSAHVA